MTIKEAADYLRDISFLLGTTGVEYLTQKDGEKMREAISTLEAQEPSQNVTNGDFILRQAAIDAINTIIPTKEGLLEPADVFAELYGVPSAQPDYKLDEWCIDCKEYDHEKHCCPRFNRVIRKTVEEVKETQKNMEDDGK